MADPIDWYKTGIDSGIPKLGKAFEVTIGPGAKTVIIRFDNGCSFVFATGKWQRMLELWQKEKIYVRGHDVL